MTSQQPIQSNDSKPLTLPSSPETVEDQDERFPVVGIGASAGGLAAFTKLLSHLATDTGMAFVLVQHLSPSQPSLLSEILARTTRIPVSEVQEGMAVEANHIYVIPPNTLMRIEQGRLVLTPREKTQRINKAVDAFFNSLAEERGSKAIAVVLSGGDSDGSQGIEAIKAAGGITFAQSGDSAQVNSMPNTAVSTGQVDFILPPEQIAAELVNISRHPYVTAPDAMVVDKISSTDALTTLFRLVQVAFGVDFTHYKHSTIQRRILRRMALYHLEKLEDYVGYLQENPAEVQALYQEILIHVTSFFRDANVFETLKKEVFPLLLRERPDKAPIRIWVAGCASGEEAYSLAICLFEVLAEQSSQLRIQIFATDVSELAIEKARLGIFSSKQVADVSPERLQRFFVPLEEGYQVNQTVREACIFARQNLIADPPFSRIDLISCRNVLIYFGLALQKKVLPMFHYGLKPTGFLMLGASETVGEFSNLFHLFHRHHKIYAKQSASLGSLTELNSIVKTIGTPLTSTVGKEPLNELSLSKLVDQVLLSQYAPAGVVINAQLDIVQFRGQTSEYLDPSPGQASLNVLTMMKQELRIDLKTAVSQSTQTGKIVRKEGIHLKSGDHTWQVQVEIVPLQFRDADKYFLILFKEIPITPAVKQGVSSTPHTHRPRKKQSQEKAEILRLEQELETTKAYLRSTIEEEQSTNQDLRAANEEILSSNEELQSTNEELQTAKEEIQASNEELITINEELYHRNAETTKVSNDFQNLLSSINIPILMLESDLKIRRFTPTAAALFNLIPTDLGRPFSDIKHKLNVADLEEQILEVINTLNFKTQEIQDQQGCWYDLRIRPYLTLDNRIDGAVLVLVEIDALKQSAAQLRAARDYAEAIVQTVRDSLLVLNENLQVIKANRRFYETFHVTPSDTVNIKIFDLGNGQWNIPLLRTLLEEILPYNGEIFNFEVKHEFEYVGQKTMRLNARRLPLNNEEQVILLAIEDVSSPPTLGPLA